MKVASAAWTLVQIEALSRRLGDLHGDVLEHIRFEATGFHLGYAPTVPAADVAAVVDALVESADLAEQARVLAERLPSGDVSITYEVVRDAALAELADGILDSERVISTAAVLDTETGWPALAACMVAFDVRVMWNQASPHEILAAFRDAAPTRVGQMLHDAGISADARFKDCSDDALACLATALQRPSGQQES